MKWHFFFYIALKIRRKPRSGLRKQRGASNQKTLNDLQKTWRCFSQDHFQKWQDQQPANGGNVKLLLQFIPFVGKIGAMITPKAKSANLYEVKEILRETATPFKSLKIPKTSVYLFTGRMTLNRLKQDLESRFYRKMSI